MMVKNKRILFVLLLGWVASAARAQVYSPKISIPGQVDSTDLAALADSIYKKAGAATPRQRAEAIWRFFLTDGRFVPPGFWYHIGGWAYEEPQGEVLDPLKLLNCYGFGLCYQLAPLLEAVYEAGGFEDARTWFLTGHTVAEVFYEGAYHHFDSDMLGFSTLEGGNPKHLPVASVSQIAGDGNILLSKLLSPTRVDASKIIYPWYPADLAAAAIRDLAALFTTTQDNWLYAFTRYPQGHRMDLVLRPGERITRYYQPERSGYFYLPFKNDGDHWSEFPREVSTFAIRTEDGPKSQKDARLWSTGSIEYVPVLSDPTAYCFGTKPILSSNLRLQDEQGLRDYLSRESASAPAHAVFAVRSPYVLIDIRLSLEALLQTGEQALEAALSVDEGRSWEKMDEVKGPFQGLWQTGPMAWVSGAHGTLSTVSGKYRCLIRLAMSGSGPTEGIRLRKIRITSGFQHNPRTLPDLAPGVNELAYHPGSAWQRELFPVQIDRLSHYAAKSESVQSISEQGQSILWPEEGKTAEITFGLSTPDENVLSGFDVGGRFLDLRDGLAPDKFTAEPRITAIGLKNAPKGIPQASIAWSTSLAGEYTPLWEYNPDLVWKDGLAVSRVLRWPEVDREVRSLPGGTRKVYVRYRLTGMGMDTPRMAVLYPLPRKSARLEIIHEWQVGGEKRRFVKEIRDPRVSGNYRVDTGTAKRLVNHAITFYCPPK